MSEQADVSQPSRVRSQAALLWERRLRLASGLVLLAFVTMHLMNHAVGIFGVDAMEAVQVWRVWLWRQWPGTVLLYGAALVHVGLALKRIVGRRTWRMPLQEALQIALGLSIPLLLYEHVIGTRIIASFAGADDSYLATLRKLWPGLAWQQTLLTLVVWGHGMIGLHYAIRAKDWYARVRTPGLIVTVMLPLLALAGFVAAGREAIEFDTTKGISTPEQIALFQETARQANRVILGLAVAMVLAIVGLEIARRLGGKVVIRYTGHGDIQVPKGLTLLEGSRDNAIPHPSLCGGRGRCSTCRVLILSGQENLPEPGPAEKAILSRINAPPRVRLACQIRPNRDMNIQILLPVEIPDSQIDWDEEAFKWGVERRATVLFVDLRAFDKLTHTQLPYDLVVLLNRFVAEMRQAVEAHGGRVTMYLSDGLMAVFGLTQGRNFGSRSAIAAARDMLKVADTLNAEFSAALPLPIRVGIGIHTGPLVMARIGDEERGFMVTALGETVTIAGKLEDATKGLLTDCLVSEATLQQARHPIPATEQRQVHIPGMSVPVVAYPLTMKAGSNGRQFADAGG
jgi:adenylate cyclase